MVYLPPPHLADDRRSYLEAYKDILTSHRRSPLSSASSVIMLVAPNVDALCASKMFARLFKLDDVIYSIIPISGLNEFEERINELKPNTTVGIVILSTCRTDYAQQQLHTLLLINMAGQTDLPRANWFGEFEEHVTFHVIDSIRPLSLDNLFMGNRIFVWDDGGAKTVEDELKESWEIVTVCFHMPWY